MLSDRNITIADRTSDAEWVSESIAKLGKMVKGIEQPRGEYIIFGMGAFHSTKTAAYEKAMLESFGYYGTQSLV